MIGSSAGAVFIPEKSLVALEKYTLTLFAVQRGSPAQNNTARAYIQVKNSDLIAQIEGGDRAVPVWDPLILDASESSDPDLSDMPFTYEWSCELEGAAQGTTDNCFSHLPLQPGGDPEIPTQSMINALIFDPTNPILEVPYNALQPGVRCVRAPLLMMTIPTMKGYCV